MRLSLTWSDPKFADIDVRKEGKAAKSEVECFERQMAQFYLEDGDIVGDESEKTDEECTESDESEESSTDESD